MKSSPAAIVRFSKPSLLSASHCRIKLSTIRNVLIPNLSRRWPQARRQSPRWLFAFVHGQSGAPVRTAGVRLHRPRLRRQLRLMMAALVVMATLIHLPVRSFQR